MIDCRNCSKVVEGKYCSNCGQKASVGELSMKELLHEVWHALSHTDTGILRLIKDLTFYPKQVYINYFNGQRKKYFSPVTFFLITAAILIFVGIKIFDYQDYKLQSFDQFGRFVLTQTKFISLLLLPIEILLSWLLFYKQFSLAKNIVFWLFLNGLLFTFKILLSPLYFIFIEHKAFLDNCIIIFLEIITFWHLMLLFGKKKWSNIIICFLLTNAIFLAEYVLSGYLLFGDELLNKANVKNIFELILKGYQW